MIGSIRIWFGTFFSSVGGGGDGFGNTRGGDQSLGGPGGGINIAGGTGLFFSSTGRISQGGRGGRYIPPGTFLQGRLPGGSGGEVSSCSNGTEVINSSGVPACQDFSGLTQFRTVNNLNTPDPRSAFLSRGFKSGFPDAFRYNGGVNNRGASGGGGAVGGDAGPDFSGGGGGSGYSDGSINLISSVLGGATESAHNSFGFGPYPPIFVFNVYGSPLRSGFIHIQAL